MRNSTASVLLLLSAGLFLTVILPYYDKVMVLRDRSTQYKGILANIIEIEQKRDDLKVKYENLPKEDVQRLEKVLPSQSDIVSLAVNFDSIAARYGISIKSINSTDSSTQSAEGIVQAPSSSLYHEATVTLSFIANYESFRAFMSDIEKSLRIIDIQSVTFNSSDDGLYDFKVTVKTYWLK